MVSWVRTIRAGKIKQGTLCEEKRWKGRVDIWVFVGSQSTHWSARQTAPIRISWCTFQVLPLQNWYGDELNPRYRFHFHFSVIFSKSLGTSTNKCLLTDYIYELTLRKYHILIYFQSETWSSVQQGERWGKGIFMD